METKRRYTKIKIPKLIFQTALILLLILLSGCLKIPKTVNLSDHINTNLTNDFTTLSYPNKCNEKTDCAKTSKDYSCLKCPNAKFVFQKDCQSKLDFVKTNSEQGLCTKTHLLDEISNYDPFHTGDCLNHYYPSAEKYPDSIKDPIFCLIQFEEYEVPTVDVEETTKFLPLWKEKLIEQSGITEQYFKEHFRIHSTILRNNLPVRHTYELSDTKQQLTINKRFDTSGSYWAKTRFDVNYYFKIDWLTMLESDSTKIKNANEENYLSDNTIKSNFKINFNHPINQILSKGEVEKALKTCAPEMNLETRQGLGFTDEGRIALEIQAEIDLKSNHCKTASVDLGTGKILSCKDYACLSFPL